MDRRRIRVAIFDRCGVPDSGDAQLTPAFVHSEISNALRKLSADRRWSWLKWSAPLTLTSGTAARPADSSEVDRLEILQTDGTYKLARPALTEDEVTAPTDRVHRWAVVGPNIMITPTPTEALTGRLWYFRTEPELTADDSEPLLPEQYHDVIVNLVAAECMTRKKNTEMVTMFRDAARQGIAEMRDRPGTANGRGQVRVTAHTGQDYYYSTWN